MEEHVSLADSIVTRLSEVVNQTVIITDKEGVVISSTDKPLIGSVSGAALKVKDDNISELIVTSDGEFINSCSGVYLPIEFKNEFFGVIGVTGNVAEVKDYGHLVKNMTDILFMESNYIERREMTRKARFRFFYDWIFNDFKHKNEREFERKAQSLDIDVNLPKRIVILSVKGLDDSFLEFDMSKIYNYVLYACDNSKFGYVYQFDTKVVCMVKEASDEELTEFMTRLGKNVESLFSCEIEIGADSKKPKELKESYANAEKAVCFYSKDMIAIYNELDINCLLSTFSQEVKKAYLNTLFGDMIKKQLIEAIALLRIFYSCDGSIQKISKELDMHKNTVQYKINKITVKSGFDPRRLSNAYRFNLAIIFYDDLIAEGSF